VVKRKVLKVGNASLAVSLPSAWVQKNYLKPGDELEVDDAQDEGYLRIDTKVRDQKHRAAHVNITGYTYYALARHLTMLYRCNYDTIMLSFEKQELLYDKTNNMMNVTKIVNKLLDRCIGAEIVSQTTKNIEIEVFASDEEQDSSRIEKRIYFLFKEMLDELLLAIGNDFITYNETIYERHDTITKFINFYLRLIDRSHVSEEQKKVSYATYIVIDHLVDQVRHLSEAIAKRGCSNKMERYVHEIFSFFNEAFFLIHNKKLDGVLVRKRYVILAKLQHETFTSDELRVLAELKTLLEVLNNFYELGITRTLGVD